MPRNDDKDDKRRRRAFDIFDEIDDIFRDLEEELSRYYEDLEKEFEDMIRSSRSAEASPYFYGVRIYIGPDGVPHVERFGNIKKSGHQYVISEETEPMVDVMEHNDEVWVIADLPGVDKDKINIDATESTVTISAEGERRKYRKVVELPAPVDPNSAVATYKNGVLEIKFKKKGSQGGVKIKVQ